ncbi:MAG TPA: Omp28-related outer membrane protein [Ignavibacteria bacterium]|nr:Omp28-related outer membrane protein [Ignavibacteria bacterium]HMQ98138.1 Omp28-related outer membrane protein [Ignavibacteria bacterium]
MKKHLLIVIALVALAGFKPDVSAQTGYNTAVEYFTGTWCQWCPCSHAIIENILTNFPNTVVLAYHGPNNDPWTTTGLPMIQYFGASAYPTGVVGRTSGIISNTGWNNRVVVQSNTVDPGVSIQLNNKNYNSGSRTLTGSIVVTALTGLTGTYNIHMVVTENNLVYAQTGNGSCPGGPNYVHYNVSRGLITGANGQLVGTDMTQGQQVTIPLNYVLPAGIIEANSKLNIVVFKTGGVSHTDQQIQQSMKTNIIDPTGVSNENEIASSYSLGQNYPNPFNPTTNFSFSIPKEQNVSLKFYNSMGQEVATYVDGFLKAGVYSVEFDGSSFTSGIYFYTLKTADYVETKKMMLVK